MNLFTLPPVARRKQVRLVFSGSLLLAIAVATGLWSANDGGRKRKVSNPEDCGTEVVLHISKPGTTTGEISDSDELKVSGDHRQPLQFRAKALESAAVLTVLASGKQTVDERVRQLQGMRGISLSKEERESALTFLAGKGVPDGMGKGSMQWLADELLTVMRLQDPPQEGLAESLAKVAFLPGTDPVVRDYIMQHLGHLWEQYGSRKEIESALWQAVTSVDETTPGTALIALNRGYERDQQVGRLAKVRQQALDLARNPGTGLAVRVTALSIAGDGGGNDVKNLAAELAGNAATPVILKKVAERVLR